MALISFLAVYSACVYCVLNSFHSHHNAERPADPIKLAAELATFLTVLGVAQRIYRKTLTYTFHPKQNRANEDKEESSLTQ